MTDTTDPKEPREQGAAVPPAAEPPTASDSAPTAPSAAPPSLDEDSYIDLTGAPVTDPPASAPKTKEFLPDSLDSDAKPSDTADSSFVFGDASGSVSSDATTTPPARASHFPGMPVIPELPDTVDGLPEGPGDEHPSRGRTVVTASARVIAGIACVGVAAVAVAAAVLVPVPSVVSAPASVVVTPVAAEQLRVCAGPLLRLGDDTGAQASSASALGPAVISADADGGRYEASLPEASDALSGPGSDILTLTGDGEQLLAGSQSQAVSSGDYVGLAAAECTVPRDDIWLVGGATTTGRTSILTIVNPGDSAATVTVDIFSEQGLVDAPGTSSIAIAPRSERIFSLAGLAPGIQSPVVHVTSAGAQVVASLQQTTVRTLDPGGLDFITAAAAPSTRAVIPGLVIPDHEALEQFAVGSDHLDLLPGVRVFVPGEAGGSLTFTLTPAGGGAASSVTIDVEAGQVVELPLDHFEDGSYAVTITSTVPFVAGARTSFVGADGSNDFAWLASGATLSKRATVAVARADEAVLHLVNPTAADAVVAIEGPGAPSTVTVPAGGAIDVPVTPDESYVLSGFDSLVASVGLSGSGVIAAHTVSPRAGASGPLTIYP